MGRAEDIHQRRLNNKKPALPFIQIKLFYGLKWPAGNHESYLRLWHVNPQAPFCIPAELNQR